MVSLRYIRGDATKPQGEGVKIIAHVTNTAGGWGRGFVNALSRRSTLPERAYRNDPEARQIGAVQMVEIEPFLWVANLCAQEGYASRARPVAVNYLALGHCLDRLLEIATRLDASVHCPRLGTGLGGGSWDRVSDMLARWLVANGIEVTVYDLPEEVRV